jgi:hypothetical protein
MTLDEYKNNAKQQVYDCMHQGLLDRIEKMDVLRAVFANDSDAIERGASILTAFEDQEAMYLNLIDEAEDEPSVDAVLGSVTYPE